MATPPREHRIICPKSEPRRGVPAGFEELGSNVGGRDLTGTGFSTDRS
jgi:hypothetical protein